jgi:hypothetical protein
LDRGRRGGGRRSRRRGLGTECGQDRGLPSAGGDAVDVVRLVRGNDQVHGRGVRVLAAAVQRGGAGCVCRMHLISCTP